MKAKRQHKNGSQLRLTKAPDDEQPDSPTTVRFVASSIQPDREGDIIEPSGWVWDGDWVSLLWAHDDDGRIPIGRAVPELMGDRLMADAEFDADEDWAEKDYDDLRWAERVLRAVVKDFLKYCSVGFDPLEWSYRDGDSRGRARRYTRQELLELSVLPVGAHPSAQPVDERRYGPPVYREGARVAIDGPGGEQKDGRVIREDLYRELVDARDCIERVLSAEPRGEDGGGDDEGEGKGDGPDESEQKAHVDDEDAGAEDTNDDSGPILRLRD